MSDDQARSGRTAGSRRVFGRGGGGGGGGGSVKTAVPAAAPAPVSAEVPAPVRGKGRPTPKRSEAQRRRTGPVPPPPATRKEAARRQREQKAEDRRTGRVREQPAPRLLKRDAGPVRALVRDLVDGRRGLGGLLMPVALLLVLLSVVGQPRLLAVGTRIWLATLLAVLVDSVLVAFLVRRQVRARFPDERRLLGHVFYALMRTIVFRKLRMPRPRVQPPPLFGSR